MRRCATRPPFVRTALGGLNEFTHQTEIAGPHFSAFRVPNVDTLYSNAWFYLQDEALPLTLPDCGPLLHAEPAGRTRERDQHQLTDAWPGPHRILLAGPDWNGDPPVGFSLFRVATRSCGACCGSRSWTDDLAPVRALQAQVQVPGGTNAGRAAASWPRVTAADVESDWTSYFAALDTVLRVCGSRWRRSLT